MIIPFDELNATVDCLSISADGGGPLFVTSFGVPVLVPIVLLGAFQCDKLAGNLHKRRELVHKSNSMPSSHSGALFGCKSRMTFVYLVLSSILLDAGPLYV